MKLVTFTSTDAPEGHRGLAMFMDGPKSFHPVFTTAETAEDAGHKLQTWWDAELERARQRVAMVSARNEKARKPALSAA